MEISKETREKLVEIMKANGVTPQPPAEPVTETMTCERCKYDYERDVDIPSPSYADVLCEDCFDALQDNMADGDAMAKFTLRKYADLAGCGGDW